jgi:hypothetical protein
LEVVGTEVVGPQRQCVESGQSASRPGGIPARPAAGFSLYTPGSTVVDWDDTVIGVKEEAIYSTHKPQPLDLFLTLSEIDANLVFSVCLDYPGYPSINVQF